MNFKLMPHQVYVLLVRGLVELDVHEHSDAVRLLAHPVAERFVRVALNKRKMTQTPLALASRGLSS